MPQTGCENSSTTLVDSGIQNVRSYDYDYCLVPTMVDDVNDGGYDFSCWDFVEIYSYYVDGD